MNIFIGELIGTMDLDSFGDGVVANVVLAKNQGKQLRVDRDHGRKWGFGVATSACTWPVGPAVVTSIRR